MKNHLLLGGLIGALIFLPAPSARAEIAHVTADTHMNLNRPVRTYGDAVRLVVGNFNDRGVRHAFVRFADSILEPGIGLRAGTLRLWVRTVQTPGTLDVHPVLDPWQEDTLRAAAPPGLDTAIATVAIVAADAANFVTIDLTGLTTAWVNRIRLTTALP